MTTLEHLQTGVGVLSPAELYAELLAERPLMILDVRNEVENARNRVRGRQPIPTLNIPYFEFIEDEEQAIARVPADRPITVICAKEGSSQYVAELLIARGIVARYLMGGFRAWLDFHVVNEVVNAPWGRIVQVFRPSRGDLSYVIISAGEAAVIDPGLQIHLYQEIAAAAQADVTRVLLTHLAAGRLSGGTLLAGTRHTLLYMHPYDALHPRTLLPARLDYMPLLGGERLPLGHLLIEAHWFPGHTPGHLVYRVIAPNGERYLLTGDALLLSGCGRTDLAGHSVAWTELLFRSLHTTLTELVNDQTLILPSSSVSLAEVQPNGTIAVPFAVLRNQHPALRASDPTELLAIVNPPTAAVATTVDTFWQVNLGLRQLSAEEATELEGEPSRCIWVNEE
ncbi:MBL fold metallo-hydrolase [Chloroflexus aggregans]|uniref:Beta-lactamase domain protein n=1 Tax=Chloroflexus aggregans (strain MD-66 / DSM 9485) TaxID=326427 RepID=B8G473_CHLAD|nr:MBL fold metallo-hydrolase [Chloroflexus aggregans]ACL23479.1 beta-lactamase domain protein [Chloroflexus aggregans DSM 9485]